MEFLGEALTCSEHPTNSAAAMYITHRFQWETWVSSVKSKLFSMIIYWIIQAIPYEFKFSDLFLLASNTPYIKKDVYIAARLK
jgi:hypothetical protein